MLDRTVSKVGAGAAMVGAVIAIVFNVFYPRADDPGSASEIVSLSTSEGMWSFTHYMLGWSIFLTFLGLIVISRSFRAEPAISWGRVALIFAIGGAVLIFTAIVMLGFSVQDAAETANAATAEAVAFVSGGLFVGAIGTFFGAAPLFYGLAMLTGDEYPAWLGWAAVAAGAVGILTGSIAFFTGFSTLTDSVLFPISSLAFTLWIGVTGYMLWQRESEPVTVGG